MRGLGTNFSRKRRGDTVVELEQYKGYIGVLKSIDQGLLHGELLGITDVVTFQGRMAEEFEKAFRDSVDEYIHFCGTRGKTPEKSFSGKFVVRIPSTLHLDAVMAARAANQSLNSWIKAAIERAVQPVAHVAVDLQRDSSVHLASRVKLLPWQMLLGGPTEESHWTVLNPRSVLNPQGEDSRVSFSLQQLQPQSAWEEERHGISSQKTSKQA